MIPFLAAQIERGSGVFTQEVRPVVPSLFEQRPSPALTGVDGVDLVEVHSQVPNERPAGPVRQPEMLRPAEARTASPMSPPPSPHANHDEPAAVRPVIPFVQESQPHAPMGTAAFDITPLPAGPTSHFDPPAGDILSRAPVATNPAMEDKILPEHQRPVPTPQWDAIHARIDDLSQRLNVSSPKSVMPPIAPLMPGTKGLNSETTPSIRPDSSVPQIREQRPPTGILPQTVIPPIVRLAPHANEPKTEATPSTRHVSSPPPSLEPHHAKGILSQQPVPQINAVNTLTPPPAPVVTVLIGRIEFRNSSRRNDSLPQPAVQTPKPDSRVVSLEDYLRHRSAGGS